MKTWCFAFPIFIYRYLFLSEDGWQQLSTTFDPLIVTYKLVFGKHGCPFGRKIVIIYQVWLFEIFWEPASQWMYAWINNQRVSVPSFWEPPDIGTNPDSTFSSFIGSKIAIKKRCSTLDTLEASRRSSPKA